MVNIKIEGVSYQVVVQSCDGGFAPGVIGGVRNVEKTVCSSDEFGGNHNGFLL